MLVDDSRTFLETQRALLTDALGGNELLKYFLLGTDLVDDHDSLEVLLPVQVQHELLRLGLSPVFVRIGHGD